MLTFSNCTCRTKTAVGVPSVKKSGAEAGMRSMPNPFSIWWPVNWTAQVAGKMIRALDDDRLEAIAVNPLQHGPESRALGHRIDANHRAS